MLDIALSRLAQRLGVVSSLQALRHTCRQASVQLSARPKSCHSHDSPSRRLCKSTLDALPTSFWLAHVHRLSEGGHLYPCRTLGAATELYRRALPAAALQGGRLDHVMHSHSAAAQLWVLPHDLGRLFIMAGPHRRLRLFPAGSSTWTHECECSGGILSFVPGICCCLLFEFAGVTLWDVQGWRAILSMPSQSSNVLQHVSFSTASRLVCRVSVWQDGLQKTSAQLRTYSALDGRAVGRSMVVCLGWRNCLDTTCECFRSYLCVLAGRPSALLVFDLQYCRLLRRREVPWDQHQVLLLSSQLLCFWRSETCAFNTTTWSEEQPLLRPVQRGVGYLASGPRAIVYRALALELGRSLWLINTACNLRGADRVSRPLAAGL